VKLGQRKSDAAPMAFIEWVDSAAVEVEVATPTPAKKPGKAKAASTTAAPGTESVAPVEGAEEKPARKPRAKKAATEEKPAEE
jgi:hypothetical protein